MAHRSLQALAILATLGLTACSGSGGGISTGSLFGGAEAKPAARSPADERTERALLAGATSARASRCGYNFDPARLRQSYIAYETAQGGTPDEIAKAERTFDFTRKQIAERIAGDQNFCSDSKTKEIKADLTKQLAGDFSAPPKKQEVQVSSGWFGGSPTQKPMDRDKIFDPLHR